MLGNNTNFTDFEYDGSEAYNSGGSFKRKNQGYPISTNEYFPVNPDKKYLFTSYMKSTLGTMRFYDMILFYDIDKKLIDCSMHMYIQGSTTELAEDLKNGDTVVKLVNANGINSNYNQTYQRGFIIWNYTNSKGYTYPAETYSRNYYFNLFQHSNVDKVNNTITLDAAWNKGTIPAGTKISQCNSGGTYKYLHGWYLVPNTWTKFTAVCGGTDYTGTNAEGKFPPGTAFGRIGWLWNYNNVDDYAWVTNVSLTENISSKDAIKNVDVEYYLSTSSTTLSGGSWSTTAPTWVNGKYMWSRQKITYGDNTTEYKNQTCIAGAKGETGSTGTGIESITEEYYLSTSKESQTGGSWSTTSPTWESGKYIWTRSKIVYKNPASIAYTTPLCSSEWEAVNELEIGGRNYILRSSEEYTLSIPQGTNKYAFRALNISDALIELDETIKTFTISFDAYSQNGGTHLQGYLRGTTASPMDSTPDSGISTTEWKRYSITKTIKNGYTVKNIVNFYLRIEGDSTDTVYFKNIKVEVGNKPTDWTPAPEDTDDAIEEVSAYAQNVANELLTTKGQLTAATTRIDSLQGIIENFVKDDNGMVTVTQTGSGMQIDMTQATNRINQLLTAIESAVTELEADQLRTELLAAIQAVQSRTAYINATQDAQGRPVITLGATDSPFKVEITNEAINFIQNGQIIAYANGQKFYNLRTVVQQDVQIGIGPGFIWKTRDSGNMGLTWVPAQS